MESYKPPKTLTMQKINFDEKGYRFALDRAERNLKTVKAMADMYEMEDISLPVLKRPIFDRISKGHQEYRAFLQEVYKEQLEKDYPGLLHDNLNLPEPKADEIQWQRYCETLKENDPRRTSPHFNPGMISFRNGRPLLTDTTTQAIRESCSTYLTEHNKSLYMAVKNVLDAIENAENVLEKAVSGQKNTFKGVSIKPKLIGDRNSYSAPIIQEKDGFRINFTGLDAVTTPPVTKKRSKPNPKLQKKKGEDKRDHLPMQPRKYLSIYG